MTELETSKLTPTQCREFARLLHDLHRMALVARAELERNEREKAVSLDAAEMVATGNDATLAGSPNNVAAISAVVSGNRPGSLGGRSPGERNDWSCEGCNQAGCEPTPRSSAASAVVSAAAVGGGE